MIHISQRAQGSTTLHIFLEGTLDHEHVVALQEVIREADEQKISRLVLHCSGLLGIDDSGTEFLQEIEHRGARLLDLPVAVSWKLRSTDRQPQRRA